MTLLMGVVNVTPDSFSDGGRWATAEAAVAHARQLVLDGADIVDVGGESTRPGATRPTVTEELDRVLPVVAALAADGARVSVDTMRARVAAEAVAAGAAVVNDVSGGLADPEILEVVAGAGVTYVCMHWRAHSARMADYASYDDGVVAVVRRELEERVGVLTAAGVAGDRIVLDPGLGFAKAAAHNWDLLAGLSRLADLGFPLLVGASRKSFVGALLTGADGAPRPVDDRDDATTALTTLLAERGVWGIRVHNVRAARDAVRVWERWSHHD